MKHKCDGCKYKGEHQEMMFRPFGVCYKFHNLLEAEKAYKADKCPFEKPLTNFDRLQADKEKSDKIIEELNEQIEHLVFLNETAKSEARKEFAEFLKARKIIADTSNYYGKECITDVITVEDIDNLLKEMG